MRGKKYVYYTKDMIRQTKIWITDNVSAICFFCTFEKRQKKCKKKYIESWWWEKKIERINAENEKWAVLVDSTQHPMRQR